MRLSDIFRESAGALRGSPTRTALTGAGVTVGALALILIVSLSIGLSTVIDQLVSGEEQLRHVLVMPGFGRALDRSAPPEVIGEMGDDKRARLRRALMKRSRGGPPIQAALNVIDAETEAALTALPEVALAVPFLQERFEITLAATLASETVSESGSETGSDADAAGAAGATRTHHTALSVGAPAAHAHYPQRLIAGNWFETDDQRGVVLHELLLYEMGVVSDAEQAALVGTTVRLTARQSAGGMLAMMMSAMGGGGGSGAVLYEEDLPLVGVLRERFGAETSTVMDEALAMQADVFVPIGLHRELSGRRPGQDGLRALLLVADSIENVGAIEDAAVARGLQARSVREVVMRVKQSLGVATYVAGFLAAIAVFVSCLGIVNTMVMSVLERTREIGLLKALGARSRDVVVLFLVEGALIGLGGGVLGLAGAAALGALGNRVGGAMIEEQLQMPFPGELFPFPVWLIAGGIGFAVITSLLASVFPALRAARIDPVRALRHE